MSDVLRVTAGELSDPVALGVLVEAGHWAVHCGRGGVWAGTEWKIGIRPGGTWVADNIRIETNACAWREERELSGGR